MRFNLFGFDFTIEKQHQYCRPCKNYKPYYRYCAAFHKQSHTRTRCSAASFNQLAAEGGRGE